MANTSCLFLVGAALAQADPQDRFNVVYFGSSAIHMVRFDLTGSVKANQREWAGALAEAASGCDKNNDGRLSQQELQSFPWYLFGSTLKDDLVDWRRLHGERGNQTSTDSLTRFLSERLPPLVVRYFQQQAGAGTSLFNMLDRDEDGVLRPTELRDAPQRLRSFDLNGDQLLTAAEISLNLSPNVILEDNGAPRIEVEFADGASLALVGPAVENERVAGRILDRYGKRLARAQAEVLDCGMSTLTPQDFAAADADADGCVTADELAAALPEFLPTAVIVCMVDKDGAAQMRRADVNPPASKRFSLTGDHVVLTSSPKTDVNFDQLVNSVFAVLDENNDAYLDYSETTPVPELSHSFTLLDADRDGKIYVEDVVKQLETDSRWVKKRLALEVTDLGRSLVDLIDADGDRTLSLREMSGLEEKLKTLDTDHDGSLAPSEVPVRSEWRLQMEYPRLFDQLVDAPPAARSVAQSPKRAPAPGWFAKMDRNGDGDLSHREFLGDRTLFERLDHDADGLISPAEALANLKP